METPEFFVEYFYGRARFEEPVENQIAGRVFISTLPQAKEISPNFYEGFTRARIVQKGKDFDFNTFLKGPELEKVE